MRFEESFELGEGAFGLPALTEGSARKVFVHSLSILGLRLGVVSARINGDDGLSGAEFGTRLLVVRLGVVGGVAHEGVELEPSAGLLEGLLKVGRVVARPLAHDDGGNQMGFVMADDADLNEGSSALAAAILPRQEVAADVARLEAGRINGSTATSAKPAASVRMTKDGVQDPVGALFFSRRAAAF